MIKRLLVANRGEVAVRVMSTAASARVTCPQSASSAG